MKKALLTTSIVLLALALSAGARAQGQVNPHGLPFISSSMAKYRLLGGKDATQIFQNIGKPTLIVFWAGWCMPCLQEVPQLNHLHATYGAAGLSILAMNMDESSDENIALMVKKFEIIYPVAIPTPELVRDFKVQAIPLTLLYGPNGQLAQSWLGPVSIDELERNIKKVMPAVAKPAPSKDKP